MGSRAGLDVVAKETIHSSGRNITLVAHPVTVRSVSPCVMNSRKPERVSLFCWVSMLWSMSRSCTEARAPRAIIYSCENGNKSNTPSG
jgi:hypothetical protein